MLITNNPLFSLPAPKAASPALGLGQSRQSLDQMLESICTQKDICNAPAAPQGSANQRVDFISDHPQTQAFYLNGIRTPEKSAEEARKALEGKTGLDIQMLYNPTDGLLADTAESLMNMSGMDTKVSRRAEKAFAQALEKGDKVQIFAHSQGAAIAADALRKLEKDWQAKGVSEPEIRERLSRVQITGFGGFATEDHFPRDVKVELFRHPNDYIPKFALAVSDLGKSTQTQAQDFMPSLKRFGDTLGSFVAFNTNQALNFIASRPETLSKCTGGSLDDLGTACATIGQVIESDHDMIVKNDFARSHYSSGYVEMFAKEQELKDRLA
ncbi:hypothetical protein COW36_05420 [bacterium (Candidatus Blackallbacteria) CG17_big_fil_post_rev_8_21_14_2_50_48_46]|uniref:DUF676 domain-containing protein n=1 Tax=bacterium (Candidatus Blackallbacteria) CG17_big_fil_post_rev_8_21_14_2_50_48_46 TaxID=2014261 RepID=A0A2M7G856_9BACT|nr:MAG: hypothetical protein COW64_21015 [bacterium (Candidatus Blackallbacteria) CG18_big_fil_WC_8_21_14_2_50_49_26]PIW18208.1 MAG: hypothetical protein COW36_05420 [bacterium (Candidatus Blackallbacteria) CG17_big_fil_post_rev_8_21_14_2_50_48_46]PIW50639.1 MAG: hypothetical protein COW20_01685 [bacterium (Candidatus Blackallbacteria) CG13_big_fil_rev_8_21_14_2_50_49_14]